MTGSFTRVGKQILSHGVHYADGADERAAEHILSRLTGWQDISIAPRDGTRILLWNADEQRIETAEWNVDFGVFDADGGAWWETTDCPFWHALPTPPVEG